MKYFTITPAPEGKYLIESNIWRRLYTERGAHNLLRNNKDIPIIGAVNNPSVLELMVKAYAPSKRTIQEFMKK